MEQSPGTQTRNELVPFLSCSRKSFTDIKESEQHTTTSPTGNTTILPLLRITTPLIEEGLVRDEQTNELYLPLTFTVVLKRKQEMLSVSLDFANNLTLDALVASRAYFSAIAHNDLDIIKQKAPYNILKIDNPPIFQIQVASGQLDKPLETATPKFEIKDKILPEHFVVIEKLTGSIVGLHFMSNNSVILDTTLGLTGFPHLMMQVKLPQVKQPQNPSLSLLTMRWWYHQGQQKQSQPLLTIHQNGTQQGLWHHWRNLRKQQLCWFSIQCRQ